MSPRHGMVTLAATLLLCLVFLRSRSLDVLGKMGQRTAVSLAGGAAVAYVLMDLSPELQEVARSFREEMSSLSNRLLDYGIHVVAGVYRAAVLRAIGERPGALPCFC